MFTGQDQVDLVEQETEAADAGSLTHDPEQEMFTGQDQGRFVRFDAKPKGTSSPKPEISPMEIGQKTFDDLFADEDQSTFEGFNTDIEAFADASELVTEDAAPHTGGGKGSSSTFHENVGVGEPECDPNSTGGFDCSQLQSCSGVEPSTSQTSEVNISGPANRPSPAKTFSERWKMRRNEERYRTMNEDVQTELPMRRSNRVKRLINRFDPSVSILEVQAASIATQTDWDDLSLWLHK